MAEIQDIDVESGEIGEIEAVEEQKSAPATTPELPEKYRGKTIEEVVKMHRDAEELIARQAHQITTDTEGRTREAEGS
jgi:hypothetical protein